MIFRILTIFPDFFQGPLQYGVVAKAAEAGLIQIHIHDLRDWTHDRHRTVDDRPFGGGEGMLLKPAPIFEAVESIWPERQPSQRLILLSAQGRRFDQEAARRLSQYQELFLICGRYEGVDERVAEHLADEELSIGDFVLSGGELAAALVIDCVARLLPGVLGNEDSALQESFSDPGPARLPAIHSSRRFPRLEGSRSTIERQSRRDPELAPPGRPRQDCKEPAGSTTMKIQGIVTCRTPY